MHLVINGRKTGKTSRISEYRGATNFFHYEAGCWLVPCISHWLQAAAQRYGVEECDTPANALSSPDSWRQFSEEGTVVNLANETQQFQDRIPDGEGDHRTDLYDLTNQFSSFIYPQNLTIGGEKLRPSQRLISNSLISFSQFSFLPQQLPLNLAQEISFTFLCIPHCATVYGINVML